MKSVRSDGSFYIESEEEDVETGKINDDDDDDHDDDDNDSDRSDSSIEINSHQGDRLSWPQSYRQSIDLYSSVQSPKITTILGTPTLSRLGSSFLTSSQLNQRRAPEAYSSSITKPLIPETQEEVPQRFGSTISQRKPSNLRKGTSLSRASFEIPILRRCSFRQAVVNGINVLFGVGVLSTPYAAKEGGWLGLCILVAFGIISFYTGILLRRCLDSRPALETYPDIGQAAFGTPGRIAISIILYVELYAACVDYIILESDTLTKLFPNAHINFCGLEMDAHHLFAFITALIVLPTLMIKDLSILSYISAGGVTASFLVVMCLFWVGLVDDVDFHYKETEALKLSTLPVAVGLFGFCYSGHAVFPNIYSSMENRRQFPLVLLTAFGICMLLYLAVAILGYLLFGESTLSQYTLNMPKEFFATKLAIWTTVINPLSKFAITMSPIALGLEELIPRDSQRAGLYSFIIRTFLVFSALIVGLAIPFFGLLLSLIGSSLTMSITLILPCACVLSILRGKITLAQGIICVIIIIIGIQCGIAGTYSAISKIVESLKS